MAPAVATYPPRNPSRTVLYRVIAVHLETLLASLDDGPDAKGLPAYVRREFYAYLQSCTRPHHVGICGHSGPSAGRAAGAGSSGSAVAPTATR